MLHSAPQQLCSPSQGKKPFYREKLDLGELNFQFAVQDIDETLGRVEMYFVSYPYKGEKVKEKLELVPCEEVVGTFSEREQEKMSKEKFYQELYTEVHENL